MYSVQGQHLNYIKVFNYLLELIGYIIIAEFLEIRYVPL